MSQESQTLSHASPRIGGLLLAAGRGRRFDPQGKRQKLLACLDQGESLILASARRLLPWVEQLTVVVGPHSAGLVRELAGMGLNVVVCLQADHGPGASLRCGLEAGRMQAAHAPVSGWLIGLADMPFISPETYRLTRSRLLEGVRQHAAGIWRPFHEGNPDSPGHPVAVTAATADRFLAMSNHTPHAEAPGLAVLWRQEPRILKRVPVIDPGCIRDIDLPGDLQC